MTLFAIGIYFTNAPANPVKQEVEPLIPAHGNRYTITGEHKN